MKPKLCEQISLDSYLQYGDRKKPGRISLLCDLEADEIYFVPKEIEHIDFAKILDDQNKRNYEKLIPSHVDILYDGEIKVIGVITGVCGLEEKLGIRHYKRDLVTAHRKIFDILSISNLKVELSENTIVKRYVKK